MKVTANELAIKLHIAYPLAASILKIAVATGQAIEVGKVKTSVTGKGKPSTVYEVNENITICLTNAIVVQNEVSEESSVVVVPSELEPVLV